MNARTSLSEPAEAIAREGFVSLPAATARCLFDPAGEQLSGDSWAAFAASWDDLRPDTYMADKGRYRLRRHAVFRLRAGNPALERGPHQPHYQGLDYNPLNGGIERWFEPVLPEVGTSPALTALLSGARAVFDALRPGTDWHVEMHQFRIQARPDELGKPTPEGMHRDGVDFVLVTLINRENVAGGVTGIRIDGREEDAASFTLQEPLDSVMVDDHRVWHGVTPVMPLDPSRPAHRDVLVLTFRRAE